MDFSTVIQVLCMGSGSMSSGAYAWLLNYVHDCSIAHRPIQS